jgi:hypothetical protein
MRLLARHRFAHRADVDRRGGTVSLTPGAYSPPGV